MDCTKNINIPDMRTIQQTAKLTGLAEHYIRQLVLTGKIVAVSAGKKYLVNIDKLIEFLNTGEMGQQKQQSAGIKPIRL